MYAEGLVYLWDVECGEHIGTRITPETISGMQCVRLDLGVQGWTSCVASLDSEGRHVVLAVSRAHG